MINQQVHIYKHVQSHTILQQQVSVADVTKVRVYCNNDTINIKNCTKLYGKTTGYYTCSNVTPSGFIILF